jgi:CDP-paratose 2-epimerase
MRTVIVTGYAGLIGSETIKRFAEEGARVVGIDNDMRARSLAQKHRRRKHVLI